MSLLNPHNKTKSNANMLNCKFEFCSSFLFRMIGSLACSSDTKERVGDDADKKMPVKTVTRLWYLVRDAMVSIAGVQT